MAVQSAQRQVATLKQRCAVLENLEADTATEASAVQLREAKQAVCTLRGENESLQMAVELAEKQAALFKQKCVALEGLETQARQSASEELTWVQEQYRQLQLSHRCAPSTVNSHS